MNTRTKRITTGAGAVGAIAAVVAGVYLFGATAATAEPEPTPTPTVYEVAVGTTENGLAAEQEADAAAAEAARIEAERVAAEAAAAAAAAEAARIEAERVAAEQEAARQAQQETVIQNSGGEGGGSTAPEPSGPTKCPAGTTPGQVDANGNESMCQTPCSEWVDNDGDGHAETCARP